MCIHKLQFENSICKFDGHLCREKKDFPHEKFIAIAALISNRKNKKMFLEILNMITFIFILL